MPEFVITLTAPVEELKARLKEIPEAEAAGTHNTEDGFNLRYNLWTSVNEEEATTNVLRRLKEVEGLPLDDSEKRQDSFSYGLKQAGIYLGKPRNYGPSEEELRAKEEAIKAAEAAAKQKEEEELRAKEEAIKAAEAAAKQ